jgi:hypothetical protein
MESLVNSLAGTDTDKPQLFGIQDMYCPRRLRASVPRQRQMRRRFVRQGRTARVHLITCLRNPWHALIAQSDVKGLARSK